MYIYIHYIYICKSELHFQKAFESNSHSFIRKYMAWLFYWHAGSNFLHYTQFKTQTFQYVGLFWVFVKSGYKRRRFVMKYILTDLHRLWHFPRATLTKRSAVTTLGCCSKSTDFEELASVSVFALVFKQTHGHTEPWHNNKQVHWQTLTRWHQHRTFTTNNSQWHQSR